MLINVFLKVLDLTKMASIAVLLVILARLLLKKAPKVFSYALWAIVLFRLLCPVTLELPVSIMPKIRPIAENYPLADVQISPARAGVVAARAVGDALNGGLGIQQIPVSDGMGPVTALWWDVWNLVGQYVWLFGVLVMTSYAIFSYIRLRKKLFTAVLLRDNIWLVDEITTPFVMGLFRPRIFLPSVMEEREQTYIILHEKHHIRRGDHIIKVLAFVALCIHWFNPLVWVAFLLAGKDMEMSCDEAVVKKMGEDILADYAASLLSLATGRMMISGMPLAFGEGDPKSRIRNLANWKKPLPWVIISALIVCVGLAVCLMANPVKNKGYVKLIHQTPVYDGMRVEYQLDFGEKDRNGKIYAEQWLNGACVRSAPVMFTQYVDNIQIYMKERREKERLVGTDVEIDTNQYGGSLLTYFAHDPGDEMIGWGYRAYDLNKSVSIENSKEKILAAMAFDSGDGVQAMNCDALLREPERMNDGEFIVIRIVFEDIPGVTWAAIEEVEAPIEIESSSSDKTSEYDWGITLSTKEVSPTGLTLIVDQSGGNPTGELEYGARFQIMQFNGENWEEAPCFAQVGWYEIAYKVAMDTSTTVAIDWEWLYGNLPVGKYRIVKEFTDFRDAGDYDTESYYADFEIE